MTMLTMGNVLGQISKKMESIKLSDNRGCDIVVTEKEKPQYVAAAKKECDAKNDNSTLSHSPIYCNTKGESMSKRFIKFIPGEEANWLRSNHPIAFLLLGYIAENVQRITNEKADLKSGEARIGDYQAIGATRQKYRTALNILVEYGYVEIVETCRTRKKRTESQKTSTTASTTASTTIGTKVKLLKSSIYDVNLNQEKTLKTTASTTDSRDIYIQERYIQEEIIITQPSSSKIDDDDFSSKPKRKERKHVHRDCYLTNEELQECIKLRGSKEIVVKIINQIIDWGDRRYSIKNWFKCIVSWNMKADNLNKSTVFEENKQKGLMFEKQFNALKKGWQVRNYRDMNKNQEGILFECVGSVQANSYFISYSDSDFNNKIISFAKEKNLIKVA